MKKQAIICVGSMLAFLAGCGGTTDNKAGEQVIVPADTATTIAESPTDTTLQVIEQLTLRAIGNTINDIAFDKDTLAVKAGSVVKLKLINEGIDMPMMHNVVFTKAGAARSVALAGAKIGSSNNYIPKNDSAVLAGTPIAKPGQAVELEFKAPAKPGVYEFVCTYPDHWQKMSGIFMVN